jgi:hypothetical protein
LKTELKSGGWTRLAPQHALEVLDRLQQGIGPGAGGRRLLAAKLGAQIIQPQAQFAPE